MTKTSTKIEPKKKIEPKTPSKMTKAELIEVAAGLKIGTQAELAKLSVTALRAKIKAYEEEATGTVPSADSVVGAFHEGKKIIKKTSIVLNGKEYWEIMVDGGVTYKVPKTDAGE